MSVVPRVPLCFQDYKKGITQSFCRNVRLTTNSSSLNLFGFHFHHYKSENMWILVETVKEICHLVSQFSIQPCTKSLMNKLSRSLNILHNLVLFYIQQLKCYTGTAVASHQKHIFSSLNPSFLICIFSKGTANHSADASFICILNTERSWGRERLWLAMKGLTKMLVKCQLYSYYIGDTFLL